MIKIAIISGPENGSPRVLAATLEKFILTTGNKAHVFYQAKAIKRLLGVKDVQYNKYAWYFYKIAFYVRDRIFFRKLTKYDAIIICDWTPKGFYRDSYDIKKLKKIINNKPVLYYAVQYLGNSPTQIEKLKAGNHPLFDRYDWHLAVSEVTEIRQKPTPPWSQIGLYLKSTGLRPQKKKEFLAVVDFVREGYEKYREEQIRVLDELGIKYISLEKKYSIEEIREIYRQASVYFIQFPEAFGMPIAECLACGSYVCTPDSSWPMAWRLDEKPQVHGPGKLPECFIVYKDYEDLRNRLLKLSSKYDKENTPFRVFNSFYKYYPTFYEGNITSFEEILTQIREKSI